MPPEEPSPVLIGVDGGASGVRALAARVVGERVEPASELVSEDYPQDDPGGFAPVPLEQQRAEQRSPSIAPAEREQGRRWVAAAARCIARAAELAAPGGAVQGALVGVALPGLKTADGRGTRVVKNGPRVPDYAEQLEARLASAGWAPARPLAELESDGLCGALGELRAEGGALAGTACGYYLGGGSGLAEALVLDGEVVALEAVADPLPRAWELRAGPQGESYEDLVAPAAVNARWREQTGREPAAGDFPEACVADDVPAAAALTHQGTWLARLVHLRLAALTAGGFHPRRAVLGQRLGLLLADPRAEPFLRRTAERELARLLYLDAEARLAQRYLAPGGASVYGALAPDLLVGSSLRAAPALGAAWRAARGGGFP